MITNSGTDDKVTDVRSDGCIIGSAHPPKSGKAPVDVRELVAGLDASSCPLCAAGNLAISDDTYWYHLTGGEFPETERCQNDGWLPAASAKGLSPDTMMESRFGDVPGKGESTWGKISKTYGLTHIRIVRPAPTDGATRPMTLDEAANCEKADRGKRLPVNPTSPDADMVAQLRNQAAAFTMLSPAFAKVCKEAADLIDRLKSRTRCLEADLINESKQLLALQAQRGQLPIMDVDGVEELIRRMTGTDWQTAKRAAKLISATLHFTYQDTRGRLTWHRRSLSDN